MHLSTQTAYITAQKTKRRIVFKMKNRHIYEAKAADK